LQPLSRSGNLVKPFHALKVNMVKPVKTKKSARPSPAAKKPGKPSLGGADLGDEVRSPFVGVRMAAKDLARLDAAAEAEGVKRSEMLRRFLLAGIAAYKPGRK